MTSNYIAWRDLLTTIERKTISDSLQSLTIRVDDIPEVLLMAISARFVHIKDLKLHANRVDEDQVSVSFSQSQHILSSSFVIQLIASALSHFPASIETVNLDLWYLDPKMSRIKWIKRAFALKSGLFDNYPALRRATCTMWEKYLAFDWKRSGKFTRSKIGRGVKTVAYVTGILRMEDT